ncbi:MAG: RecX family transcriptional regulator [Candidatus Omnitrophica bacterium]|nr:RecX family transcriptional regulator [Candidatus Omnitrophota bacterium]
MKNKKAYSRALRLLAGKSYSEEELKEKLSEYAAEPGIDGIIEECVKRGYLNDRALAEYLAEKYLKKTKGYLYILSVLERRKIRQDAIEEVKRDFDFEREFSEAEKFFLKNRKKKKLSSLLFSLKTKGFSYRSINRIMNMHRKTDE